MQNASLEVEVFDPRLHQRAWPGARQQREQVELAPDWVAQPASFPKPARQILDAHGGVAPTLNVPIDAARGIIGGKVARQPSRVVVDGSERPHRSVCSIRAAGDGYPVVPFGDHARIVA